MLKVLQNLTLPPQHFDESTTGVETTTIYLVRAIYSFKFGTNHSSLSLHRVSASDHHDRIKNRIKNSQISIGSTGSAAHAAVGPPASLAVVAAGPSIAGVDLDDSCDGGEVGAGGSASSLSLLLNRRTMTITANTTSRTP